MGASGATCLFVYCYLNELWVTIHPSQHVSLVLSRHHNFLLSSLCCWNIAHSFIIYRNIHHWNNSISKLCYNYVYIVQFTTRFIGEKNSSRCNELISEPSALSWDLEIWTHVVEAMSLVLDLGSNSIDLYHSATKETTAKCHMSK